VTDAQVTVVASGFGFLEAPRWHEDRIWFSDFYTHQVRSARADGSELRTEASVPQQARWPRLAARRPSPCRVHA
jgi:hypothetical protein